MSFQSKADSCKRLRIRLLTYLFAALIFAMPVRSALENHFLYFPENRQEVTPAAVGLTYDEIAFNASDGTALNGWLLPGLVGAPVVLFCMGNAGNISNRMETLQLLHHLGVAVFIFNYRGYGKSAGSTTEAGTYQDIASAMEVLNQRGWTAQRTIIFGRSLGAAIALEGALRNPPAGLIMEAAFTSVRAMGQHHYPLLSFLLGWLMDAKYDNSAKIVRLECPLLLIHGTSDTVCPPWMAEELFAKAPHEKQVFWIHGADHNDGFVVGGESYTNALRAAIARWTGFTMKRSL
jgi:fermentation-respiration switch protein FrsA (DUF1100 family)